MYIRGLIPRNWTKQFRLVGNELTRLFLRKISSSHSIQITKSTPLIRSLSWASCSTELVETSLVRPLTFVRTNLNLDPLFHGIDRDIVNKMCVLTFVCTNFNLGQ